jgi:hypothetical protein
VVIEVCGCVVDYADGKVDADNGFLNFDIGCSVVNGGGRNGAEETPIKEEKEAVKISSD